MSDKWITGILTGLLVSIVFALLCPAAQAGPQLVCWPFDTGGARSLPWGGDGWHDALPNYDPSRLATDTVALLSPEVPVLARMETLRRAAIYAAKSPQAAKELFARLEERTESAKSPAKSDPLVLFDLGYFNEAYRQASGVAHSSMESGTKLNGYELVQRALAVRGSDAQMEFAAALVASAVGQSDAANQHLAKAAASTADGSLLARNLLTHCHLFRLQAGTLAELRSRLAATKS
jgi:hypothetical protein